MQNITRRAALAIGVSALVATGFHDRARAQAKTLRIVVLGDSLSAGYQLPAASAFPAKLEVALKARGHAVTVVNAGVSGDTAQGGLARLDWSVPEGIDAVIVELGANDALRGIDPAETTKSLDQILTRLAARKIPVLLAGMLSPPNLGADYGQRYEAMYQTLAKTHDVVFYPFFLDGVAANPALNLGDGMHPNAAGVDAIVTRIMPSVETLLARAGRTGG